MREVIINKTYKHFKGNLYKVLHIAYDCENEEKLVVYQGLYGENKIWVRKYDEFNSLVDKQKYKEVLQKYRFELVD